MKKILVIRLGAIGDVILTSPAIINLKLSFPESRICFLTRPRTAGIVRMIAGVDDVIEFPEKASFRDLFRMGKLLDKMGLDMVVDLHGNFRSFYLSYHIAAPIKVRYKKRRWERFLAARKGFGKRLNPSPPHTIDLYNEAVNRAGGKIFANRPALRVPAKPKDYAIFNDNRAVVAIAPGASYPTKKWSAERFSKLTRMIHDKLGAGILLILTEQDREIMSLSKDIPEEDLKILMNKDLSSLASQVRTADILVCNDSALSHLGSAVGTPVIALFGPTHPTLGFSPRGMRDVVMGVDEPCRPCSLHGKKACFREEQFCLTRITVDDVFRQTEKMIDSKVKGERAIFVDRDGTLIKEKEFIRHPDQVEPEEKSIEAVKLAKSRGFKVIVISNQSGVARGFFTEEDVRRVNDRVLEIFNQQGAAIDDILFCPHFRFGTEARYAIECSCRKPSPGMIEEACLRHNINPFESFIIGDKPSDIQLAFVTGGRGILVRTGYGIKSENSFQTEYLLKPEIVVGNLFEGVNYIANLNANVPS